MQVLHLTTEFPPVIYGGLGTAVGGLVRASAEAGIGTGVMLFGPVAGPPYGRPVPVTRGTERLAFPLPRGASLFEVSFHQEIEALARAARSMRADILHLHSFWLWPYAQALRERLQVPLVYTVHSLDRAEYEIGHGPPECVVQWVQQEAVIAGADRIIALTHSERELIGEYCPGVRDRIRVVGNGVHDIPLRQRGDRPIRDPVILFSGRFVERKGIRELIEAIRVVHGRAPGVRFVLAGGHRGCSGAEMASWLLPADEGNAYRKTHFTGWLAPQQIASLYDEADILVVPSWYEPFGMVVLEGMLHGLTVAASAIGGPAEILEDGQTGCLFAPRDSNALAACMLDLARDPDKRMRIAQGGARAVREKWLWPQIVRKMMRVYAELCAPSGGH